MGNTVPVSVVEGQPSRSGARAAAGVGLGVVLLVLGLVVLLRMQLWSLVAGFAVLLVAGRLLGENTPPAVGALRERRRRIL
jgi:hypothetical protein